MKKILPMCVASLALLAGGFVLSPLAWSQRSILEQADEWTLLSLNPDLMSANARWGGAKFHRHRTLGQVKITDGALKERLTAALFRGIEDKGQGMASCFKPRHGIRARRGWRTVDVVICFECGHVHFHEWGRRREEATAQSPRALFDGTLRAAGVRVAKPSIGGP